MKEFFVSDLHIGHENCLRFDNRPFKDLAEQNESKVCIGRKVERVLRLIYNYG